MQLLRVLLFLSVVEQLVNGVAVWKSGAVLQKSQVSQDKERGQQAAQGKEQGRATEVELAETRKMKNLQQKNAAARTKSDHNTLDLLMGEKAKKHDTLMLDSLTPTKGEIEGEGTYRLLTGKESDGWKANELWRETEFKGSDKSLTIPLSDIHDFSQLDG